MRKNGEEIMEYLKIKDDVDLKELEKFGFEKDYHNFNGEIRELYTYGEMIIFVDTREVYSFKMRMQTVIKLFDITQAGLVEKVREI